MQVVRAGRGRGGRGGGGAERNLTERGQRETHTDVPLSMSYICSLGEGKAQTEI